MNAILQIFTVTLMNLRNIPQRLGSSMVIVIGMASVVAVMISILALANGAQKAVARTGSSDRAIVLHAGALSELLSNMSRGEVMGVQDAPGVQKDKDGKSIASAESIVLVEMKQKEGPSSNLTLRGVGAQWSLLRPEIKIIEGRAFNAGLRELLVGKSAKTIFGGFELGSKTKINGLDWTVVGVFESDGDTHESEILSDSETVLSAFRRESFQSVLVKLNSATDYPAFRDALASNPQLLVSASPESEYYAQQSRPFAQTLSSVAFLVGGIMAIGAFFGAINSMYSALSTRTVEIATLRAIGFGSTPIVISIFIESLLLALTGAAIGAVIAKLLFAGHVVNTNGGGLAHAQYLFAMNVTAAQVIVCMILACIVGIVGALFPAIHAVRMSVVTALRGN